MLRKLFLFLIVVGIGVVSFVGIEPIKEKLSDYKQQLITSEDTDRYKELLKNKTEYIGDNSKVAGLLNVLPEINPNFKQKYFSIHSDGANRLNIYYEPKSEGTLNSISYNEEELKTYAAMLFAFIGNADEIQFFVRETMSNSRLDETQYKKFANFTRSESIDNFGDLAQFYVKEKYDNLIEEAANKAKSIFSF